MADNFSLLKKMSMSCLKFIYQRIESFQVILFITHVDYLKTLKIKM